MINLKQMTTDELRKEIARIYAQYQQNCVISQLYIIARTLGCDPAGDGYISSCGPKFKFVDGNVSLYVDDYGGYMTVSMDGKRVLSTHQCDQFIIPGAWIDTILAHYPAAQAKITADRAEREQSERNALLSKLLFDEADVEF
jgi:hypothetical protein